MNIITFGFDPDVQQSAIAGCVDGKVAVLRICARKQTTHGEHMTEASDLVHEVLRGQEAILSTFPPAKIKTAIAVEWAVHHKGARAVPPNDLAWLHGTSGCAHASARFCGIPSYLVTPGQWKGSIPKDVHHRRILKRLGWATGDQTVPDPSLCSFDYKKGQWKHLVDAIGLALFAYDRLSIGQSIESA